MKQLLSLRYRCALLLVVAARFASAGLLLDPTGGTSVGFPANTPGARVSRDLGGTFRLYGANITSINLSSSGFLSTAPFASLLADRSLGELASAAAGPVVAPFYDFLAFGDGSTVTDLSVANQYYAATYQSMYGDNDTAAGHSSDFQVVLFMAATDIGNFHFLPGEIAFSYGNLNSAIFDASFTVGVAQTQLNFDGPPASADGRLSNFSTLPTGSQFILFRPRGIQRIGSPTVFFYESSIESAESTSAVPEPTSMALFGLGLLALGLKRATRWL